MTPVVELLDLIIGTEAMTLNQGLIERQGLLVSDILELRRLHANRLIIYQYLRDNNPDLSHEEYKMIDKMLTDIEFELQEVWGFPKDKKFHRFWERPGCKCPHFDNEDWYPSGRYVINGECPMHG